MKLLFGSASTKNLEWNSLSIFEKKLVSQSFKTGLLFAFLCMLLTWMYCGVSEVI